jgi:hypothetical protein
MNKISVGVGVSTAALMLASPAAAATCVWKASTFGNWTTTANWSCGALPSSADDVQIGGSTSNAGVTLTGTRSARNLTLLSRGTLAIGDGTSTAGTLTLYGDTVTMDSSLILNNANTVLRAASTSSTLTFNGTSAIQMFGGQINQGSYIFNVNVSGSGLISGTNVTNNRSIMATTGVFNLTSISSAFNNVGSVAAYDSNLVRFNTAVTNSGYMFGNVAMSTSGRLTNLSAVGSLVGGYYGTYDGNTMKLTSSASGSGTAISSIGSTTAPSGTDTTIEVGGSGTIANNAANSYLENSLTTINLSGKLFLNAATTRNWSFVNNGMVELSASTMNLQGSNAATGTITGFGTLSLTNYTNNGLITARTSSLTINSGGFLNSTAGTLRSENGGTLTLTGSNSLAANSLEVLSKLSTSAPITVTSSYANSGFGTGNSFNARANVTGTGAINAANASDSTMSYTFSGPINSQGQVVLATRVGGTFTTQYLGVKNSGSTIVTGTVKSSSSAISATGGGNFTSANSTGGANYLIALNGVSSASAGNFTIGTITVANNFDNITDRQYGVVASVWQPARPLGGQPANISLVSRVGDTAPTASFTIGNDLASNAINAERLVVSGSVAGLQLNGSDSINSLLLPGVYQTVTLSPTATAAGSYSGTLSLRNVSQAWPGQGLNDLTLSPTRIAVSSKIYAPAVAQLSSNALDLGTVRQGGTTSGSLSVKNSAVGSLADTLVTTLGNISNGLAATAANSLASGQSGALQVALTAGPGQYAGTVAIAFASHNPDMADLALAGQTVNVTATVTELAKASLIDVNKTGALTGGGNEYTINFGNVWYKAGTATFSLGLKNDILASGYGEKLGGSWTSLSGSNAFSFSAEAFGLIQAGASIQAGILNFTTSGRGLGQYLASFDFKPKSHYDGLVDADQQALKINVMANLVAVPEPAVWLQMFVGFGLLGGVIRKRQRAPSLPHVLPS